MAAARASATLKTQHSYPSHLERNGTPRGNRLVLFLAYMFPPLGGGGVQRSLKFSKYLPPLGWQPIVLTVKRILYHVYDEKLVAEVPESVEVIRTESLDPLRLGGLAYRSNGGTQGNGQPFVEGSWIVRAYRAMRRILFFPDAQVGWIPFAFTRGLAILRARNVSVIYSPGAPYSSAVVAYLLSRASGVPYVVDFRDGWTDDAYHSSPTKVHMRGQRFLERLVVTHASAICVYGDWLGRRLSERYPETASRMIEIPNGFDPADLDGIVPAQRKSGRTRLVYSGSLYAHHRPAFQTVLNAIGRLPESARRCLEIVIVGQFYLEAKQDVMKAHLEAQVEFRGYVPHADALSVLLSADASLLLIRKGDFASVTGKVFELLMIQRPIIALVEGEGECARILRAANAADHVCAPDDTEQVARALLSIVSESQKPLDPESVARFSRVTQTRALADVFDIVSERGHFATHDTPGARADEAGVL